MSKEFFMALNNTATIDAIESDGLRLLALFSAVPSHAHFVQCPSDSC